MKRVTKWVLCVICALFLGVNTQVFDCQAAVYTPAVITKQPENYYGEYGSTVTFSIEVSVSQGSPVYYQWYYRTSSSGNWVKSSGFTRATVTTVFYQGMDNWEVACLVSDGRTVLASDVVKIVHGQKPEESTPESTQPTESNPDGSETGESNPEVTEPDESNPEITEPDESNPEGSEAGESNPEITEPEQTPPEVTDPSEIIPEGSESGDTTTDTEGENAGTDPVQPETGAEEGNQAETPSEPAREYVTPEQFGAKGDGVTDDSTAIQSAVNSGKDVVFDSNKTYFIAANKYISINNKTDFHMSGGRIHKAASASNYNLFVIRNCTDCTFENMYIYSEFTCRDIMVPSGHTRPTNLNSNVLAFAGINNSNIRFLNNSFDYMSADYWFNGNTSGSWYDVTVDGWTSSTSMMPMYGQYISGLTVKNATVSMNPSYAGNGDHCIYMCTNASNIRISDSSFNWYGNKSTSGTIAVLSFHGGSASAGTQPKDILVSNCSVYSGDSKTVYVGEGVTASLDNCNLSYSNDSSAKSVAVLCGYGSYVVSNSTLSGYDTLVDARGSVSISNSILTGANANGIFGTAPVVTCTNCNFNIGRGVLYYVNSGSGVNHSYVGCSITKSEKGTGYIISKRSTAGSIYFEGCSIDCGKGMLIYNGGRVNMTGISLINTQITNASMLCTAAEKSGYTAQNSTCNGSRI